MITIELEGIGKVEVDPSFLNLSPEEQQATASKIAEQASPRMGRGEALARTGSNSFLFGLNDELRSAQAASGLYNEDYLARPGIADPIGAAIGGARMLFDPNARQQYDQQLERERAGLREAREEHQVTSFAGDIVGGVAQPLNYLGGAALRAGSGLANAGMNVVRGAVASAPFTAAYGFGEGEGGVQDRLESAALTTAIGAPIAGVAGAVTGKVGEIIGRRGAERAAAQQADEAARRQFDEFGISPSRAQVTGRAGDFANEDSYAGGAFGEPAQNVAQGARSDQFDQIEAARARIGADMAVDPQRGLPIAPTYGTPADAAQDIGDSIGRRVEAERLDIADRERQARGAIERTTESGRLMAGGGRDIVSDELDAGRMVSDRVRAERATAKQGYRQAYDDALTRDGEFARPFIEGMGPSIRTRLTTSPEPIVVDELTPAALGALRIVDDFTSFVRPRNAADPAGPVDPASITAINLSGIDRVRKMLRTRYDAAQTPTDRTAVSRIIQAYDDEVEAAMSSPSLYQGDDQALDALRAARQKFRDYSQTFGVRDRGDDAGRAIQRIVSDDAQPVEVANLLYGQSRIGETPAAIRTAQRLRDVLGEGSDEWLAIRQGAWQRLLATGGKDMDGATAKQVAERLDQFASGRGRGLAETLFAPDERQAMTRFSSHLRAFADREDIPSDAMKTLMDIATKNAGPEDLARRVAQQAQPGASATNRRLIMAVRDIFGENSAEMSATRQLVWQQLTGRPEGVPQRGTQDLGNRLNKFLNGDAKLVARVLYTDEQRALMQRYADVMSRMTPPPGTRNFSQSGNRAAGQMLGRLGTMISTSIGGSAGGGTGALMGYVAGSAMSGVRERMAAQTARRVFSGDNPALRRSMRDRLLAGIEGTAAATRAGSPAGASEPTALPAPVQ